MRTERKLDVPFRTQQFILLAAQAGSFHKAARAFGVDPAVVIRSINKLEDDLGVKIFDRSRNRFIVTDAGEFFVREIQEAVAHVERACDLIRYRARVAQGPLRLGFSAYIDSRLVSYLQNLQSNPGITAIDTALPNHEFGVQLESDATIQLVDRVLRGELHVAFGVQPVQHEDLWGESVGREAFCLCISKNHRLAKQPAVLAREMDGERLFFLPRAAHPGLYNQVLEYIESTGARPVLNEVTSFTHTMEIVAHNFGIALLPRSASRLSYTGVLFKPVTDRLFSIETVLFRRLDQRERRVMWLVRELLRQAKSLPVNR
jgi:DNA-binding transcriptional LysR family regulator